MVPEGGEGAEPEATVRAALADAVRDVDAAMEDCQFQKAVRAQRAAWAAASRATGTLKEEQLT